MPLRPARRALGPQSDQVTHEAMGSGVPSAADLGSQAFARGLAGRAHQLPRSRVVDDRPCERGHQSRIAARRATIGRRAIQDELKALPSAWPKIRCSGLCSTIVRNFALRSLPLIVVAGLVGQNHCPKSDGSLATKNAVCHHHACCKTGAREHFADSYPFISVFLVCSLLSNTSSSASSS